MNDNRLWTLDGLEITGWRPFSDGGGNIVVMACVSMFFRADNGRTWED